MKDKLGDSARISHILDSIKEIESYISGATFQQFRENSMMQYASIKQLEIIGEAANHISENLKLNLKT